MKKQNEQDPEDPTEDAETTAGGATKSSTRATESDDDDDGDDQSVDDEDDEESGEGDDDDAEGGDDDAGDDEEEAEESEEADEEETSELETVDETEEETRPAGGRRERHPEDGRLTGLLNQMPEAVRREILDDPGKFGRMIQELRAGREVDYGSAVERAVAETVGEFSDMSPANRKFFETLGKKLSGAIGQQVSKEARVGGERAHRQFVVREGMRKVQKTELWKNGLFKKAFWGEVELMRQARKFHPPDVLFKRVEREFKKAGFERGGETERSGGERPRRQADLGARPSGAQGMQKKEPKSSLEAWLSSDAARQLDRRENRRR